jgi:hypothetical protein
MSRFEYSRTFGKLIKILGSVCLKRNYQKEGFEKAMLSKNITAVSVILTPATLIISCPPKGPISC